MVSKPKRKYQKPQLIPLGKIKWDEEEFKKGPLKEEILKRIKEKKEEVHETDETSQDDDRG